MFKPNV